MCASALPREYGTHEIGVEINKNTSKCIPKLLIVTWKWWPDFSSFWYKHSRHNYSHQTTVQIPTSPNVCFWSIWKKTEQAKYALQWTKNVNKCYISWSVAHNNPDLGPVAYNVCGVMQQRVYRTPFRNVDELKKRLVEVWSRTLSTLLSTKGESICVPVFAQRADISHIYCKQLDNWTIG